MAMPAASPFTMKRPNAASGFILAIALFAAGAAHANSGGPSHESWWLSWLDSTFGTNFGGVVYGDDSNRVVGSDKLVHQIRSIAGVRGIEVRGPINVVLKQSPAEKLTLHTDDNLAPLIETPVVDGILLVGVKAGAGFHSRHAVGITVELPGLRSVKLLGSGDFTSADLETDLLDIAVQGSGNLRIDALRAATVSVLMQGSGDVVLSGTVPKQGCVIAGGGDLDAGELAGRDVAVRVAGSGSAHVWVSQTLSVDIDGSGNVHYRGKPSISKSIKGSGNLLAD